MSLAEKKTKLKDYFKSGAVPTAQQFSDLIDDSLLSATDSEEGYVRLAKDEDETSPEKAVATKSQLTSSKQEAKNYADLKVQGLNLEARITEAKEYTNNEINDLNLNERFSATESYSDSNLAEAKTYTNTYADNQVALLKSIIKFRESVRVVLDEPLESFQNSQSSDIDGYTIKDGDRVLLINQPDSEHNRVWIAKIDNAWDIADDFSEISSEKLFIGLSIEVMNGNIYSNSIWTIQEVAKSDSSELSEITWEKRNDLNHYTEGDGISISDFEISTDQGWLSDNIDSFLPDTVVKKPEGSQTISITDLPESVVIKPNGSQTIGVSDLPDSVVTKSADSETIDIGDLPTSESTTLGASTIHIPTEKVVKDYVDAQVSSTDAAKEYIDSQFQVDVTFLDPVAVIFEGSLSELQEEPPIIDGYTLEGNDRILLIDQNDSKDNRIWIANSDSAWSIDENFVGNKINEDSVGLSVKIINGTKYSDTFWTISEVVTANDPSDNEITWLKRTDLNSYTAGEGIAINNLEISLEQPDTFVKKSDGKVDIDDLPTSESTALGASTIHIPTEKVVKDYVDAQVSSTDTAQEYIDSQLQMEVAFADPVAVLSKLELSTLQNNELPEIDKYQVQEGDRVLLIDQDDSKNNRVWIAKSNSEWLVAGDFDEDLSNEVFVGLSVEVKNGNDYLNSIWAVEEIVSTNSLSEITWKKRNDLSRYTAGEGIAIENLEISLEQPDTFVKKSDGKIAIDDLPTSTETSLGNSESLIPTEKVVKDYVDSQATPALSSLPVDSIVMYVSTAPVVPPAGWSICNGESGTVDLSGSEQDLGEGKKLIHIQKDPEPQE